MSGQFRGIRPEDMTKLQQIAEMMSRGVREYALRIANSIDERVAREVADVLVNRASNDRPDLEAFARELEDQVTHGRERITA